MDQYEILTKNVHYKAMKSLDKASRWILDNIDTKNNDDIFDYNDLDGMT